MAAAYLVCQTGFWAKKAISKTIAQKLDCISKKDKNIKKKDSYTSSIFNRVDWARK